MNFGFKHQNEFKYYNFHGSNGYTYVNGIGFAPPPPEVNERRLLRRFGNCVGFSMLFYLALSVFLPRFLLRIISVFIPTIRIFGSNIVAPSSLLFLIDIISYILVTIVPFLIYSFIIKIPHSVYLPNKPVGFKMTISSIAIGLGASVIGSYAAAILYMLFTISGKTPTMPDFSTTNDVWSNVFLFTQTVLLAPILEEIVFRGIFMQSFRRFGDAFALVISSMLFALAHGNFIQSPNAFIVGLVIGYFVLRCGSLRIGIYIHVANNLFSFITGLLVDNPSEDLQFIIFRSIQGVYILLSIIALLYILKKYQNFFSLDTPETVTSFKGKSISFLTSGAMLLFLIVVAEIMISSLASY